ncbi:hypothetical protein [Streptomyces sclerotialus]|uniref:hypothetical protein n=1 Tax=Streptomyces sclerotialus TaxID=1957 RepID=UPI000AB15B50
MTEEDYSPLSIHTGIPWGVRSNADQILAYLREQCALLVGPTGSGKTNLVHTVLAGFARAEDVLTWVIDLNAGSADLPWVRPALTPDGTVGDKVRPGIDWLAATPKEAGRMLEAMVRIAKHRKTAYQELMAARNTDLLPISRKIPQIMLVIDEGAEILASNDKTIRELAKLILEVIRIMRAMGGRTILTALGATGSVLGNLMIRREAKVRVALTGGETEGMDLGKMFPGRRGLKVEQAPYKGSGFMGTPESPAGLFKNWRILPNQIRDIVHATSDRHPVLDEISARAAGPDYATRWDADRLAWMGDTGTTETAPVQSAGTNTGAGLNLSALREQSAPAAKAGEDADALARKFMQQIDEQFGTTTDSAPVEQPAPKAEGLNLSAPRLGQQRRRGGERAGVAGRGDRRDRVGRRHGHEALGGGRPRRPQPPGRPQGPPGRRRARRTDLPGQRPALGLRPPRPRLRTPLRRPQGATGYWQLATNQ